MKSREELIEEYLEKPYEVGEYVLVQGLKSNDSSSWFYGSEITKIEGDDIFIQNEYGRGEDRRIVKGKYKKCTRKVGYDPINYTPWNRSLRIINFNLQSILFSCGWERRNKLKEGVEEINWNPTIKDEDGKDVVYQRPLCWSLKEKQLLINSIYNYINIGMIVVKVNGYAHAHEKSLKGEVGYYKDIVDGKQRLNAILGFVNNEFPDSEGYYWKDFSDSAQSRFLDFSAVSYGEIGEDANDQDVKDVFLGINFTGVPMSKEHIEFVKSINLKK